MEKFTFTLSGFSSFMTKAEALVDSLLEMREEWRANLRADTKLKEVQAKHLEVEMGDAEEQTLRANNTKAGLRLSIHSKQVEQLELAARERAARHHQKAKVIRPAPTEPQTTAVQQAAPHAPKPQHRARHYRDPARYGSTPLVAKGNPPPLKASVGEILEAHAEQEKQPEVEVPAPN